MAITIRKGTASDLDAFVKLLSDVRETMPIKEWFYLDKPEDLRQQMEERILELWLAMDGENVAGAFNLVVPGMRDINYGYALGFSERELLQVINMDAAAVHPDYRGQGIQRKLMMEAEKWLKSRGKWILLCTIHPENCYSLQNALKIGYAVQKKLPIYGSVRYILRKDI